MPAKKKTTKRKTSVKKVSPNKADMLIESSVNLQKTILALVESNNALNKKIESMVQLFDRAAGNIDKIKEGETKNVENLARRLNSVVQQNKDLARGLVLLEEYVRKRGEAESEPKEIPEE